jgi:Flp pilus assembly protein TadD
MRLSLLVCSCLVLGGCNRGAAGAPAADSSAAAAVPEGHVPVARATPLPSDAQVLLDSANTRYAERDYKGALAGYRRALAAAPGHPAPWWGIAMAANMLGDSALADSARRLLESRGVKPETEHGAAPKMPASPHGTPM